MSKMNMDGVVTIVTARSKIGEMSRCMSEMIDGLGSKALENLPRETFDVISRVQDDLCLLFDKLPVNLKITEKGIKCT